ncbi:hypothetical protein PR048_013006 [Dryococelus australis]|uniref:Titin n=1 Tax=Dryococelus australis TaxID=614101 RepID=A0ABQ9HRS4_9NEOP|nr:hypothetical protein PR048_013006 [Dryococelus australis]
MEFALFTVRPFINREKLHKVVVRAGQFVKFDVDIKGEPPPTVTWKFANKVLENTATMKIENEDYNTKFTIADTTRKNSGMYTVKAENSSGQDEATVEVNILDKPDKPQGPLEVKDVHKEGCKLSWDKPKDDGGLPLTGYVVEKMDTQTGRWVPAAFVDPSKTEQEITGLEPNKKYHFRVKAVNEEGESEPLGTDTAILAKNPFDPPSAPGLPEIVDWNENMVKLKWERPIRDGGAPITGYVIEMMDKYGGGFVKCAEVPGNMCEGTVPKLEEGNQYQFRVRAVNKAGPGDPSEETNPHTAKARFLKPRIDRTNLQNIIIKVGLTLSLDVNIIGEPPPDVTWTFKDQVRFTIIKGCGYWAIRQLAFHKGQTGSIPTRPLPDSRKLESFQTMLLVGVFSRGSPELKTDDLIRIDNIDYNTKFFIMRAKRSHSGKYIITAKNSVGEDKAEVEISVLAVRLLASHEGESCSITSCVTPDFRKWGSCRTMQLVGEYSRRSSFSPSLAFWRFSILTTISPS